MKLSLWIWALSAAAGSAAAEQVVCKTIADTWVEVPEFGLFRSAQAQKPGHGSDPHLVIGGRQSFALLQFDLSPAKGMTVSRAVLRIHRAPAPVPPTVIGLSTVSGSAAWSETGAGFEFAREGRESWAYPNSDITDVTFGLGGSLYAYPPVRDAGDGWYEADVPPALVHALLTGDQYGLMLDDEKGQTETRHVLSSREGPYPPVLLVEGTRSDHTPPGRVKQLGKVARVTGSTPADAAAIGLTTLRPGSAIVRFGGAGDDSGRGVAAHYELRYSDKPLHADEFQAAALAPRWALNPLAPKPSPMATANALQDDVTAVVDGLTPGQTYYFAARALDAAGNAGPVTVLGAYRAYAPQFPVLPAPAALASAKPSAGKPDVWAVPELWKINPRTGAVLEAGDSAGHRAASPVWDAGTATVRLRGARNEFVAFQVAVEGNGLTGVELKVTAPLFAESGLPPVFERTGAIQLYREWFVPDDRQTSEPRGWYPDPLVPLSGPFDIPAKDNAVPGQTVQPAFVDIYIPHDAAPGKHTGELLVTAGGARHPIHIEVEVLPLTLPDKLNFLIDLNCYNGVNAGWNIQRGTPEYRALEIAYHRLAHLNRGNLDVLGYNHDGRMEPDHAPGLTGAGAETRISDWSGWDALFGPIVSGSAFRDLPRAGTPVPIVYLPFFEGWPGDFRRGYQWDDPTVPKTLEEYQALITKHSLRAGPVEEGFSQEYQDRAVTVADQFAAHIKENGWMKTRYMVFFNDKRYFKRPSQGGHGISWWLFDEPNFRDDVRATSFLGALFMRGMAKHPDVPIVFRADISRVEWVRDLLTNQLDIDCTSQDIFYKNRFMLDNRRQFGKEYWHYSSTNHPRDSNVAMRAWAWKAWLAGAEGIVPWNTVRGAEAWDRADPLTVFYVGTKLGSKEPFASLRLKAFRRGEEDVEYLVMLARKAGWDRDAVTHAVSGALDLSQEFKQTGAEDAGTVDYHRIPDSQLEGLLERVSRALRQ